MTEVNAAGGSGVRIAVGSDFGLGQADAPAFDGYHICVANSGANSLTMLPSR